VSAPEISVVVPSHARRLRLRWLLNALEDQTLAADRWEAIVVHDYGDADSRALIAEHPLARAGVLRDIAIEPGTGSPARQRNLGWRAARGPLVAFTDDDCRPASDWLDRLLAAAGAHPGAIVQGTTRPDPYETAVFAAPHVRTLSIDPPGPFAQTCNILYPRAVLEAADGFDERALGSGEDTDLGLRARAAGAGYVGAQEALVHHAVEAYGLRAAMRLAAKWRYVPYVVRRHPEARRWFALRVFWRPSHLRLTAALLGLALARRFPLAALLVVPYLRAGLDRRGGGLRRRLICAAELPGQVAVDLAEVAALARGSVRYRTLVL
jgi:GT2 family glycosyltransferase